MYNSVVDIVGCTNYCNSNMEASNSASLHSHHHLSTYRVNHGVSRGMPYAAIS